MRQTWAIADHRRVIGLAAALVVAAGLLMVGFAVVPGAAAKRTAHAAGANGLSVGWGAVAGSLEITATGFRPASDALVSVGSIVPSPVQTDALGTVHLVVALDPSAAGLPGTSVVVTGKAPSGATKTLVTAAPPTATVRGAADLMPWWAGAALLVVAVAAVPGRWWRRLVPGARAGRPAEITEPTVADVSVVHTGRK
jgi:hypothetical protein